MSTADDEQLQRAIRLLRHIDDKEKFLVYQQSAAEGRTFCWDGRRRARPSARPTTQKLFNNSIFIIKIFHLKLKTILYSLFEFNFNSNSAILHSKLIKTTRKHSLIIFDNRPSCQNNARELKH